MFENTLRAEGTIKVNGTDTPLKINLNAIRLLCQMRNLQLENLDTYLDAAGIDGIASLAYAGVKAASAKAGKTYDVDYDTFCAGFLDEEEGGLQTVMELLSAASAGEEEGNTEDSGNE